MSVEEQNLAVVKRFYELFAAGNVDECTKLFSDDFILHEPDGLPYGGKYRGKRGVLDIANRFLSTWATHSVEVVQLATGGDHVMSRAQLSGSHAKTGRSWSMPIIEDFRMNNGVIVEMTIFYFDACRVSWAADYTPQYGT
ncbi:MAG: nuclear transport factor 2 family protein [Steroidobacteraceae bacterium]